MAASVNMRSLEEWQGLGFQVNEFRLRDLDTFQVPATFESRTWAVAKYASLYTIPLIYNTAKTICELTQKTYHAIRDTGPIVDQRTYPINPNIYSVFYALNNMRQLGPLAVNVLAEKYNSIYKDHSYISASGIPTSKDLQDKLNQNKTVIIPVVLKGGFFTRGSIYSRDHITTLIINPMKHEIIYDDPQGKTLGDNRSALVLTNIASPFRNRANCETVNNVFRRILGDINSTVGSDGKPWRLEQRITKYQPDAYNCGLHFLHNAKMYPQHQELVGPIVGLQNIRTWRGVFIKDLTS